MKAIFALSLAVLLGAASVPPGEVQTGRSVVVDKAQQTYWLSNDLNRLFLQKPDTGTEVDAPAATRPVK